MQEGEKKSSARSLDESRKQFGTRMREGSKTRERPGEKRLSSAPGKGRNARRINERTKKARVF